MTLQQQFVILKQVILSIFKKIITDLIILFSYSNIKTVYQSLYSNNNKNKLQFLKQIQITLINFSL
jgi:hypothetical protein